MALKEKFMVETGVAKTAAQTVSLQADAGESLLVKDIRVGDNDCEYANITVDKTLVGSIRTAKALGTHLGFGYGAGIIPVADYYNAVNPKKTILGFLADLGVFTGYPVAEGETLTIAPSTAATYLGDVSVEYELYEAGDIKETDVNGSKALEYIFINYGDIGSALTTAGDWLIDTVNSPSEFPDFPIGKDVPAKYEIDLIGILGSEAEDYDAAAQISYTKYLKLVRDREVLFDKDRNGILFRGGADAETDVQNYYGQGNSLIGNLSPIDTKPPLIFPEPIKFLPGEELNVYIVSDIVTAAASIAQAGTEIGFIERVRKVS